ncbi:hypothetical protein Leryth_018131 [Lithospermum erythrorhizon]|nr:hypothetical protein Leryth_018131 [Lithospermum erythrorhizon]
MSMHIITTKPQLFFICIILLFLTSCSSFKFKCASSLQKCDALIDYIPQKNTTLIAIRDLFNIKNLRTILGVNNLPLLTPPNQLVPAKHSLIKIPLQCICTNGTGKSNKRPIYKVENATSLERIATEVFAGLVSYEEIQEVNNVRDPKLVKVGQRLWIPLPCSCDDVEGERVVHYGHLVGENSTVEGIAQEYNTTQNVIMRVNGLVSPNDLKAGAVLDVPLKACTSLVNNNSLDYPLLVSSGTYIFTAANCVKCTCDAANNWT